MEKKDHINHVDAWTSLRSFTNARIALGRTGVSVPIEEALQFKMAHANARDAVFSHFEKEQIFTALQLFQQPVFFLRSSATDRHVYLQRPDLGRRLNEKSINKLNNFKSKGYDICICIADGLSSTAVNMHAVNLLLLLVPMLREQKISIAPFCIVEQGRVAVSDETGNLLKVKLSVILIGERPGLTAADSMSAYLTYNPSVGLTDESRNCISNIRPEGMSYATAADKIFYMITESIRLKISGVHLKDNIKAIS
ncbi:ethanolamine ammonia-lyase subunit EutC [Panacibacter ginsenosidivorans]|uniref:Ethanolamine ammonia-lyase small subunit n=1 Tax=Panacibacter ginsenosidivorans TaxID=1813871 RepID=A0A5B8VFP5_9BACT|nr:ethanolamine ammonia-lyase subunit EutC [Panacibacter ginsenosidivorans]